ncbi:hypothetical protein G4228_007785, partial [Cervus hanglu yarkandensis]
IMSHRQAALEITARYCGRELEQYGQCVAAKPESWQRDCHHLKMSIAQCTSAHPIIRQIRQACLEPFKAFEECLRQNEAAVGNCAEHVRRFLQCAEQVQPTHRPSTLEVSWGSAVHPTLSSFWLLRVKTRESPSAPHRASPCILTPGHQNTVLSYPLHSPCF